MGAPTVRRRRLGAELRRLREQQRLTTDHVAKQFGWHNAKVSRIETGRSAARPGDVQSLLDLYGTHDDLKRRALVALARNGNRRGWWQTYSDVLTSAYTDFISLEADATVMRTYECGLVPGLFQTAAYARDVIAGINMTETSEEVDRLAEVRQARQAVLTRPNPLEVWAVVDEGVLRTRTTGGPHVMCGQLQRMLDLSAFPNVTIQVMPQAAGPHPGRSGAFAILGFPERHDMDVVLVENLTNALYMEEQHEVDRYAAAFQRIVADALSLDDSLHLIRNLKDELSEHAHS